MLDGAGDPERDGGPLRPGGVAAAHLLGVAVDFLDVDAAGARIEGQAGRERGDQAHQLLEVLADRERIDVRIALGGRSGGAFEDQEARFDAGAAALVDGTRDAPGEQDAGRRGAAAEGVAPGGGLGDAVSADDDDEAAVGSQRRVGRLDVGQVDMAAPLADRGPGGERRVHEDDVGAHVRQPVADLFGVVPGDAGVVVDHGQQRAADVGQFVQVQLRRAVEDGARQRREHAGAGGRLEQDVRGLHRRGDMCGAGEHERRRELVERDLVLAAVGVGGLEACDALDHPQQLLGIGGDLQHRGPPAAQEQDGSGLGGVVAALGVPGGAFAVDCLPGVVDGGGDDRGDQAVPCLEDGQEVAGGCREGASRAVCGRPGSRWLGGGQLENGLEGFTHGNLLDKCGDAWPDWHPRPPFGTGRRASAARQGVALPGGGAGATIRTQRRARGGTRRLRAISAARGVR